MISSAIGAIITSERKAKKRSERVVTDSNPVV